MEWKDIMKQKPLNLSPMEAAVAVEYGDANMQQMKAKIESLIPKMPTEIKEGYMKAIDWFKTNMDE